MKTISSLSNIALNVFLLFGCFIWTSVDNDDLHSWALCSNTERFQFEKDNNYSEQQKVWSPKVGVNNLEIIFKLQIFFNKDKT